MRMKHVKRQMRLLLSLAAPNQIPNIWLGQSNINALDNTSNPRLVDTPPVGDL